MDVPFLKMHGLGNDFVVIDARQRPIVLTPAATRAIADRRRGVGCDQLITIEPPAHGGAAFLRIRNPDGGEAQACGNATRCVAQLLTREYGAPHLVLETQAGQLDCRVLPDGQVTVDMGRARTGWREIPVARACDTLDLPIAIDNLGHPVGVNIGNPHAVFFVPDVGGVDLARVGPLLERDSLFPDRVNVEVVEVRDRRTLRMRVWERGAGMTQACGSGACAAAVAAHRRGLAERRVSVILDGGTLIIEWREDGHVLMTGPVATSFSGTLNVEALAGGRPEIALGAEASGGSAA